MSTSSGVVENLSAKGLRFGIIVSRFNQHITSKLLEGAEKVLKEKSAKKIDTIWVPGAYEVPLAAQVMAQKKGSKKYDALIALACVIRGDTTHYDYVCEGVSRGILDVSLKMNLPIAFGVLTTENNDQALERVGGRHGHKGEEAALTVIEMIKVLKDLRK
ncbi:MAG: 6,7-dimethyl-8-ribityllumazine synthase [Deltaproteobacteria bacterium]|nr:MAG: 6,7-dimethyl-8-ribityllumazine synthase [Deltaproteobacteria bacterium]